jgi:hypothetical protein
MRRTLVRWVAVLWCVMTTPMVLESAQLAGRALDPPPAMDFTLKPRMVLSSDRVNIRAKSSCSVSAIPSARMCGRPHWWSSHRCEFA